MQTQFKVPKVKCGCPQNGSGTALFQADLSNPQGPPVLAPPSYPAYQPLYTAPALRTSGQVAGHDFDLTATGMTIRRSGMYHADALAVLLRSYLDAPEYATFVVSLIVNGQLGVDVVNSTASTNTLWNGGPGSNAQVLSFVASNVLHLRAGDTLQLVVSDAGREVGTPAFTARLLAWSIALHRISGVCKRFVH
jgi:hypothetical protein